MKRYVLWGTGFVLHFIINMVVELILLPSWGLDNTEQNDIYFQIWWIVVGLWLVFGIKIANSFENKQIEKKSKPA